MLIASLYIYPFRHPLKVTPTNSSQSDNQHKPPSRLDIRQVVYRFLFYQDSLLDLSVKKSLMTVTKPSPKRTK